MGKSVNDEVLDAALDHIATSTSLTVCETEPTTYTEATSNKGVSGYALASVVMTAGDGNGDYTIANGDTSGRKISVLQQSGATIDVTGTAQHIALCDADTLLYVTTCTSQALTSPGTVTCPEWDIEIADPTA